MKPFKPIAHLGMHMLHSLTPDLPPLGEARFSGKLLAALALLDGHDLATSALFQVLLPQCARALIHAVPDLAVHVRPALEVLEVSYRWPLCSISAGMCSLVLALLGVSKHILLFDAKATTFDLAAPIYRVGRWLQCAS